MTESQEQMLSDSLFILFRKGNEVINTGLHLRWFITKHEVTVKRFNYDISKNINFQIVQVEYNYDTMLLNINDEVFAKVYKIE